jgi:hypothetical protein
VAVRGLGRTRIREKRSTATRTAERRIVSARARASSICLRDDRSAPSQVRSIRGLF